MRNGFFKGHGLGNDYLVVDPHELTFRLTPRVVRALCDRRRGLGADGVLVPVVSRRADFGLRIFNPDGSEAEKSGNGLRIFARYLHATRRTRRTGFRIDTRGGVVTAALRLDRRGDATRVRVEMGAALFHPASLPCTLRTRELVDRPIRAGGRSLRFTGVSVGNPHCVVFARRWNHRDLLELGPLLEHHRIFPRRTNVQLARVTGPQSLDILIWERGAGETAASGTSACAAAAAAVRRELVTSPVRVKSPGGTLRIAVDEDWQVTLDGPVAEVARGRISGDLLHRLRSRR